MEQRRSPRAAHHRRMKKSLPPRHDTHITAAQAPDRPGINAQTPGTMPRGEDDASTREHSPEFHDRPGSGRHIADRHKIF
jgi:hypothetical protein